MEIGAGRLLHDLVHRRYRFRQALGWAFVALLVALAHPVPWGFRVGAALCLLGESLRLWAAGHVHKNRALETHGPYAFVRHPQYLGNCLIAVGLCLAAWRPLAVVVWALLFCLFYLPAIAREDDKLRRRFGDAWQEWRQNTPAVVPTHWPVANPGLHLKDWSLQQCVRNGEPVWLGLLILCVFLIRR